MRAQRWLLICIVALSCLLVVPLQAIDERAEEHTARITGRLSATTAHVAEPIQLDLVVTAPTGCQVTFPSIASQLGDFEVVDQLDRFDIPAPRSVGERIWTRRLTLESLITGELQVPALEVQVTGPRVKQLLRTDSMPVRVLSLLKDGEQPSQFRDIETVVDVAIPKPSSHSWMWWTLGLTGSLAMAMVVVGALRRRGPQVTPATWAMREIEQLEQSAALTSCDFVDGFRQLTTILRDYLEMQFNVSAQVQTTEELVSVIRIECILPDTDARCFANLFATADQVKFAGLQPSQTEFSAVIAEAKRLIERTAPDARVPRTETKMAEDN